MNNALITAWHLLQIAPIIQMAMLVLSIILLQTVLLFNYYYYLFLGSLNEM